MKQYYKNRLMDEKEMKKKLLTMISQFQKSLSYNSNETDFTIVFAFENCSTHI